MARRPLLDDPQVAAQAWARYRRLMCCMMLAMVTFLIGGGVAAWRQRGAIPVEVYVIAALVLGVAMLALSAAMGLAFLPRHGGRGGDQSSG